MGRIDLCGVPQRRAQVQGTKIRVLGGTNDRLDMLAFVSELTMRCRPPSRTMRSSSGWPRGWQQTPHEKDDLRQQLRADADSVLRYHTRTALTPFAVGPGRVDALALIHNNVMTTELGIPEIGARRSLPSNTLLSGTSRNPRGLSGAACFRIPCCATPAKLSVCSQNPISDRPLSLSAYSNPRSILSD